MTIPHFEQSKHGYCLPACARMVLAAYGEQHTELSLTKLLQTQRYGTPFGRLKRLTSRQFNVDMQPKTFDQLRAYVDRGVFPIVSVRAEYLSWTDFEGAHALVLVSAENDALAFHDPAYSQFPQWASPDEFMISWIEHGELSAVITRK